MPTGSEDSTTNETPEVVEDAAGATGLHGLGAGFPSHATVSVAQPTTGKPGLGSLHVTDVSSLGTGSIGKYGSIHHSDFASEEESEVHTEVLREKAERGTAALKEMSELLQAVKEQVALSESFWTGEGADLFRETMALGIKGIENGLEAIAGYPRELIAYADRHDGVITKANALASGADDVEWPEDV